MPQPPNSTLDARRGYHGPGDRSGLSGWLRAMLGGLAAVAAAGFALGWRNVEDWMNPPPQTEPHRPVERPLSQTQ
ncbi:MAG: hypothetical protein WCC64_17420 [Aliidongia sp.]